MPSKWAWIMFNLVVYVTASLDNDMIKAFLELREMDYEDTCSNTSQAEWSYINSPSNETLLIWEEKLISYATFKKTQRDEIANITETGISDPSLKYKSEVAERVGDALLNSEDYKTFVHFAGTVDYLRLSTFHTNNSKNITREDAEHILSHNNAVQTKRNVWTTWHQELVPLMQNYSVVLPLVIKAAKANDAKDVKEYWELLSGYTDGYDKMKFEWTKITKLHKKILQFVKTNLVNKYDIRVNDTIPAYLLGSLQGSDWTPLSVDTTPHPNVMYDIKKNLWERRLIGKSVYTTASALGLKVLNQVPQADFWEKSHFNKHCPPKLINFCREGIMRVSTCFEPTISNFLSAHGNVGKILFNQISAEAIPILNTANRYSVLEEGLSELFGILAASPAWLNHTRLMNNSTNNDEELRVSLMITALNTLPRLAYYMSVDAWRLNALEMQITNPKELVSSWWKYRQEYEGVSSNGTEIPTFLNDDYITNNKPYLPKIAGTILAFQLYEYLMESTEVRYHSILAKQMNANFIKMIQQGGADNWMKVIENFLEIDEIYADALVSFFSPLEDFIDELEEDFQFETVRDKELELEELEKSVIKEMNAPPTTTTTTTPMTIVTRKKPINSTSSNKQNDGRSNVNAVDSSKKHLEPKPSIQVPDWKAENSKAVGSESSTAVPFDESLFNVEGEEDTKPKINTNKAVWAVGAVLLGTVVICVIAIFGRRRCRKTPKNRRYV